MDTAELERGLKEEDLAPVEERVIQEELDRREQAVGEAFEKGTLEAIPEAQDGGPAEQDGAPQQDGSAADQQEQEAEQQPEADAQPEADSRYEVRERDDGRLSVVNTDEEVVSLGETGEVGPGSPGYDPALEQYFRTNAGALEERGESAAATLGRGKSEAEVERAVANRSTSPIEILDTYRIVRERAQREAQEGATRDPVAEAIDAEGRFDTESFEAAYDSGTNRENPQVALNWLSSEGRALDAAADEISRETGRDVTEQDIVEHLLDNPGGPRRKSETERQADELARRFEEVTGVTLTPERAERLGKAVDEALMPAETAGEGDPEGAPEALFQTGTERGSGVLATYAGPSAEGASEARAEGRTFEGRYDEQERFEIDDSEAQLSEDAQWNPEGTEGDAETLRGRLGDVLDHPALFEAYPELEDVQAEARVSQEAPESGSFRRGREVSTGIGSGQTASAPPQIEAQAPTREGLRSVLLHEIQHAIQEREGFARGSNPQREAASFEEGFRKASELFSRARRIQDSEQYAQEERAYGEALDDPGTPDEEALQRRNEAEAHARVSQLQARAERALGRDIATLNRLERQALVEGDPSAFDAEAEGRHRYERSAGEIEARDVQARRDMDAEERAATEPYSSEDIPADRAVVRGTGNARRRMDARARGAGVQASEPTPAAAEQQQQQQQQPQQARTSERSGRVPVRTDQTSGEVVPFREMVRQLEDRAGVSRVERSTTGPEGSFRPADARITARGGQSDLDTVIHEVAHALDDKFKVIAPPERGGPDQATLDAMQDELVPTFSKHGSAGTRYDDGSAAYARAEGFAEWLRAYAADPAAAKEMAPETHRVAKEALSEEAWAAVEQFGDRLRAFAGASERGDAEGVLANVREGMGAEAQPGVMGRVKRFLRKQKQRFATNEATGATWLDRLKGQWTDEIAIPIKAQMLARQLRGLDEALPSDDFEALFRLFQGTEARFGQALESGMFDSEYNTVTPGGFDWLMEPMESREDLKNTAALLIAERTVEKAGQIDDAAARIAGAHGTIQQAEADLASMREGSGSVDEAVASDLEETIRGAREEMQEAAREVGYEGAPQNVEAWAEDKKRRLTGIGGGVRSDQQAAWDLVEGLQERDPDAYDRAKEAARRYREWTDSLLRFWVEKGRLSEEKYQQIRNRNQSYVPLNRVMEDADARETDSVMRLAYDNAPDGAFRSVSKMTQSSQLIYEFQGSTREIENPYAMLIAQTQSFIREAERNEVMRAFAEPMALGDGRAEREMYDGRVMDTSKIGKEVPSEEAGTQTIYFDGEARHFDFHADVQQAFDDMSPEELGPMLSAFRSMFRFSKDAITLAPPFLARQFLRDPQERAIKGETHAHEHLTAGAAQALGTVAVEELIPGDTKAHQFLSSALDGEGRRQFMRDMREYERVGGAQFGWHGRSAKDHYSEMRQLMADHFGDGDIVTTLGRMKDGYKRLAHLQETANRVAEYTKKRDDYRAQGYGELDARIQAAADARGLIDFAKAGRIAKKINRVVPFFNATIQGIATTAEAFKERPVHTATRMTMYAMATDLFFYGLNVAMSAGAGEDEQTPLDDWRQQSRYMKDFFYTVPLPGEGRRLRIPKTYEFGAISSAVVRSVDASLAAARGNEAEAARAAGDLVPEAEHFSPIHSPDEPGNVWTSFTEAYFPLRVKGAMSSPAFSPFGAMANYDYFREESIVSLYEEGKKLELREGTERASPAGQALQEVFQVDARQIDYLSRNVFGGFGRLAMSASERVAGDKSSQARSLAMELSGLATRPPAFGARDVQWVKRWAERNGETQSKPVRALDALESRYYEADNPQEAARVRKRLIETAKTLRTRIEENQSRQSSQQPQQSP